MNKNRRTLREKNGRPKTKKRHKRDASATRQRILDAARKVFAENGLTGARVDQIALASEANVQMIYRYFGSKEDLYLAALADTYARIRELERTLDLSSLSPVAGVRRLIEFTFDYLDDNPEFVAIIRNENGEGGQYVRRLPMVSDSTQLLLEDIEGLVRRGRESGEFACDIDTRHLYVAILSLCMGHQSQRSTLSVMLRTDLGSKQWLAVQRQVVVDMVLGYLTAERVQQGSGV